MSEFDERKNADTEPTHEILSDDEEGLDEDLHAELESMLLKDPFSEKPPSRHMTELLEKGYTRKAGKVVIQAKSSNQTERGAEIAASLTDENFETNLAKRLWEVLPDDIQNGLLVDFQCSGCLLLNTLGITQDDVDNMTHTQFDAAMAEAMKLSGVGSPNMRMSGVTQVQNIRIFFGPTNAPGDMDGRNALQIDGDCEKCGATLTRTLTGGQAQLLSNLGNLLEDTSRHRNKIGRNDPCPCGSGLKYKKCCGKA